MGQERPLRAIALHEAGHAVAYYWHSVRCGIDPSFEQVSIERDEHTLGRLIRHPLPDDFNPIRDKDPFTRMTVEVLAISALAGPEAESRVEWEGWTVPDDMGMAVGLVSEITETNPQFDAYLVYVDEVTKITLELPPVWGAIEALADRLMQVGTVLWDEVHPLIDAALDHTFRVSDP